MPVKGKDIKDLEDTPAYQYGQWYGPCVKIYTLGGPDRIAEVSTYPRAYQDTKPHVYSADVTFIVGEADLNDEVNGDKVFRDSENHIFRRGETAVHLAGDSLPGAFPLWIESPDLPFVPQADHVFPIGDIPGPIKNLAEAARKVGNNYVNLPAQALQAMKEELPAGKISLERKVEDPDKQIIRIRYQRRF